MIVYVNFKFIPILDRQWYYFQVYRNIVMNRYTVSERMVTTLSWVFELFIKKVSIYNIQIRFNKLKFF